jgi:hypothetical protein
MSNDDLSIIAIDLRNPRATLMTICTFYGTLHGNNKVSMTICCCFLDGHIRDVEGNLKGLVHCLTLFLSVQLETR